MDRGRSRRSFASVKLTARYHLPYMGLWILVCSVQILVIDALLYRLLVDYLGGLEDGAVGTERTALFPIVMLTIISVAGIVSLAILTAHRIAGPYIALTQACRALADGKLDHRLHFRQYDQLAHVADEFNRMVDALRPPRPAGVDAKADRHDGTSKPAQG